MTNVLTTLPRALIFLLALGAAPIEDGRVEVPVDANGSVAVSKIVAALAEATGQIVRPPDADVSLPIRGLPGALGRTLLGECLGDDVHLEFGRNAVVFRFPSNLGRGDDRAAWRSRLEQLAAKAEEAAGKRLHHALRARESYRPNDPSRPTICLVHGINSSSGGFVHMIPWLEGAGYGIVFFDYPYNQRLDRSCEEFRADWLAFRERVGERRPWTVLTHSMGALLARSYIEGPGRRAGDVDSLIMIAPVNQGANVARIQPLWRMISGMKALGENRVSRAMAELSEGDGQSAKDMLPGSPFLNRLNRNPPNEAVAYHIIAGDAGVLSAEDRKQIESRLEDVARGSGFLAPLTRLATGEVAPLLDELTDGTGDGCVAVERTRIPGGPEPVILHANHAELIRAPLLYADPGPVVSMPQILRWLKEDHAARRPPSDRGAAGPAADR